MKTKTKCKSKCTCVVVGHVSAQFLQIRQQFQACLSCDISSNDWIGVRQLIDIVIGVLVGHTDQLCADDVNRQNFIFVVEHQLVELAGVRHQCELCLVEPLAEFTLKIYQNLQNE